MNITVGIDKVKAACESAKQNPGGGRKQFPAASPELVQHCRNNGEYSTRYFCTTVLVGETGGAVDAHGQMGRLCLPGFGG